MFGNVELGDGRQAPWGPQAVVIPQGGEVQLTAAQLTPQIPLHAVKVVLPASDMEGIDHDFGGLIRRQGRQQLAPQLPPRFAGKQIVLQLGAQQGPRFAAQALDHVSKIDAPQCLLPFAGMQPRQRLDKLGTQEQIQPVVAQMHRQLLADQP